MVKPEKVAQVESYAELIRDAKSVYLADYIGLDVASMQEIRKQCRSEEVQFAVVKNRLMKRAATDLGLEGLAPYLQGPTAVAISRTDEVSPAKILVKFAKDRKKPELKAAVVDGEVFGPDEAKEFAKLPTLDEMRATLLNMITAPAAQLVRTIAEPAAQLARVLDARRASLGE